MFNLCVLGSIFLTSCWNKKTINDFCGQTVAEREYYGFGEDHHYLYFKERGGAKLVSVEVTNAEYNHYTEGTTIDCDSI